jgi:bleomycin hydrolase
MGSSTSKPSADPVINDEKAPFTMLSTDMAALNLSSPKSSNGSITLSNVASWESSISADPKLQLARTILSHSDIKSALQSRAAHTADVHVFNTEIDFKTLPITDQKNSGRCWIFASTNVLRYEIMKKLKLKEFQVSQVYIHKCIIILIFTPWIIAVIFIFLGQVEQGQLLSRTIDTAR